MLCAVGIEVRLWLLWPPLGVKSRQEFQASDARAYEQQPQTPLCRVVVVASFRVLCARSRSRLAVVVVVVVKIMSVDLEINRSPRVEWVPIERSTFVPGTSHSSSSSVAAASVGPARSDQMLKRAARQQNRAQNSRAPTMRRPIASGRSLPLLHS
uniref:Putative secreted protein n=1 Tax=Anopheles darlingi TaxID=43151 RepID=A0A2M4D5B2_ANODA